VKSRAAKSPFLSTNNNKNAVTFVSYSSGEKGEMSSGFLDKTGRSKLTLLHAIFKKGHLLVDEVVRHQPFKAI
jgi:hypothetical protein